MARRLRRITQKYLELNYFHSYLHKVLFEFADFVARASPATAGAVIALILRMEVVAKPTTKSAGFNLRIPVGNALVTNKFCEFCGFCVKENIIGVEVKDIYWHAEFAELRRSTWNSIVFTTTYIKFFFEFADFVARASPATAGAVGTEK